MFVHYIPINNRTALLGALFRLSIPSCQAGKRAIRLGMTWNDQIWFVLTEQLQIKRLVFLNIIKEKSTTLAGNADDMFELDFALITSELANMLTDLTEALGGEILNNN